MQQSRFLRWPLTLAALAAACLWNPYAAAETIEIGAGRDGTLFEDPNGALASGAGPHLFAGNTNGAGARRALVWFELPAALLGATILDAELQLEVTRSGQDPQTRTYTLHRVLADWGTGASNSGQSGGGVPAQADDATWTNRFHPGDPWASNGGDFVATASASQGIAGIGAYVFGSAALVADVQAWADGAANYGWILLGDEASFQSARRFAASENTAGGGPLLRIDYEPGVPEPAAAALLALALGFAAVRRLH